MKDTINLVQQAITAAKYSIEDHEKALNEEKIKLATFEKQLALLNTAFPEAEPTSE